MTGRHADDGASARPRPAGHGFPGAHGLVADRLAEVDAALTSAVAAGALSAEREALCRKRFHAAAALARHDPEAAAAALERLAGTLRTDPGHPAPAP